MKTKHSVKNLNASLIGLKPCYTLTKKLSLRNSLGLLETEQTIDFRWEIGGEMSCVLELAPSILKRLLQCDTAKIHLTKQKKISNE